MTFPGLEREAPWIGFFRRIEQMASTSFLTIPYVGPHIAEFFNQVVIPYCTPGRDRIMRALFGRFKGLEGGFQILLMRLLPLPGEHPSRGPR